MSLYSGPSIKEYFSTTGSSELELPVLGFSSAMNATTFERMFACLVLPGEELPEAVPESLEPETAAEEEDSSAGPSALE